MSRQRVFLALLCVAVYAAAILRYSEPAKPSEYVLEVQSVSDREVVIASRARTETERGTAKRGPLVGRRDGCTDCAYPSGVNTTKIIRLHNIPRYTFSLRQTSSDFRPEEISYWEGVAFLATTILVYGSLMCCPCCCVYMTCSCTKFCGLALLKCGACSSLCIRITASAVLLAAVIFAGIGGISNFRLSDNFRQAFTFPERALTSMQSKYNELIFQANEVNITVPDEVTNVAENVNKALDSLVNWQSYDFVKNLLDVFEAFRTWSVFFIFLVGALLTFTAFLCTWCRGRQSLILLATGMFISIFLLCILGGPTMFVNEALADICVDCNDLLVGMIDDQSTQNVVEYFLFCDNSTNALNFMNSLIDETQKLSNKLEAEIDSMSTDDPKYQETVKRYNQTQKLLSLEQDLMLCNETSSEYYAMVDFTCKKTLGSSYDMGVSSLVLVVLETLLIFILPCVFCAAFPEEEKPENEALISDADGEVPRDLETDPILVPALDHGELQPGMEGPPNNGVPSNYGSINDQDVNWVYAAQAGGSAAAAEGARAGPPPGNRSSVRGGESNPFVVPSSSVAAGQGGAGGYGAAEPRDVVGGFNPYGESTPPPRQYLEEQGRQGAEGGGGRYSAHAYPDVAAQSRQSWAAEAPPAWREETAGGGDGGRSSGNPFADEGAAGAYGSRSSGVYGAYGGGDGGAAQSSGGLAADAAAQARMSWAAESAAAAGGRYSAHADARGSGYASPSAAQPRQAWVEEMQRSGFNPFGGNDFAGSSAHDVVPDGAQQQQQQQQEVYSSSPLPLYPAPAPAPTAPLIASDDGEGDVGEVFHDDFRGDGEPLYPSLGTVQEDEDGGGSGAREESFDWAAYRAMYGE